MGFNSNNICFADYSTKKEAIIAHIEEDFRYEKIHEMQILKDKVFVHWTSISNCEIVSVCLLGTDMGYVSSKHMTLDQGVNMDGIKKSLLDKAKDIYKDNIYFKEALEDYNKSKDSNKEFKSGLVEIVNIRESSKENKQEMSR